MKIYAPLFLLSLMLFYAGAALGNDTVEITEWSVPWKNTRPRDPYVDTGSRVWFVGQKGDYLANFSPMSDSYKRFDLGSGTGPHNLLVDGEGMVWYAGNRKAHIGKLNPVTGNITQFPMAHPEARDPHTLVFDRNGDIWFTVQRGNFIGKFSPATGKSQFIPVPTPNARPYGIIVGSQNRPWIAEFGTNKLASVDPKTMKIREISLLRIAARPRRLAETSNGHIWYVDYARGFLGRLNPVTGDILEWPVPGGASAKPYGMSVDNQDRLWFVECGPQPNRFVGFEPVTQKFFSITDIRSGGGCVRHMFFHAQSGEIWFGTDKDTIGRAKIRQHPLY
jgi:virginiamycin B lyase